MSNNLKRLFNNFSKLFLQNFLLNLIFGWCLLAPLSIIIPKKRNLMLFLARFNGVFGDNVKYLYLYLSLSKNENIEFYFLSEDRDLSAELKKKGLPVIFYPSVRGLWKLLRSKIIIVDSNEWMTRFKDKAAYRAYKVQLWHGTGIKRVVLDNPDFKDKKLFLYNLYYKIKGTFVEYDLLLLTSGRQAERRAGMFPHKKILINGQPRNDIIFQESPETSMLFGSDTGMINRISVYKKRGYKIILYTPTWRETETDLYNAQNLPIEIGTLSEFLKKNRAVFVFKFHPKSTHSLDLRDKDLIVEYNSRADIYPFMNLVDIMITDYSSIYLDFILLDRPVLFFPYDFEIYTGERKRTDPDDYMNLTPGPKCYNYQKLQSELYTVAVEGRDEYARERQRVRNFVYDYDDGKSCERIIDYLLKEVIGKN